MSAFIKFLKRVQLKKSTLGPFQWEIAETPGSVTRTALESSKKREDDADCIDTQISLLSGLIRSLENFHSNPEGIYYIGQTLIEIDSYLDDNGIVGEPADLTVSLMKEIDEDTRRQEGLFEPYLTVSNVNKLKRALKQIRAEIVAFQNAVGGEAE